jgi:hypothetical protein
MWPGRDSIWCPGQKSMPPGVVASTTGSLPGEKAIRLTTSDDSLAT